MIAVCPVVVGRERELERAGALLASGGVAVVAGETGVGKTRLVQAVRDRAEVPTAAGACLEPYSSQPFAPVAELLRDLRVTPDVLEEIEPWLLRLLPGGAVGEAAVDEQARYRIARGVCALVERSAPLLIVLEDLHWADAATLELLPWLARRVRDRGVLVLVTCRSDEPRPDVLATLAELERQRLCERIDLAPLAPPEVDKMVRALAGDVDAAVLETVRRRSDGNPLFVEELVRTLGDDVPPTIQEAILRRVGRLPEPAVRLLQVAAVMGERFELEPVRLVAGVDEPVEAVRAALDLELVREEPGGGFRFRHALARDAVYERLLVVERQARHRELADRLPDARAAEAAFHYEAAGEAERARERARRAADQALALGAFADARSHLLTALRVAWGARERAELLALRGKVEHALGNMDAAIAAYRQAAALYGDDVPAAARALLDASLAMIVNADRAGGLALHRSVLELLEPRGESNELAWAYRVLGSQHMLGGAFAEGIRWSRRAITIGDGEVVAEATNDLGVATCLSGHAEEGLALLRSVLPAARAYVNLGHCLTLIGRYEEAISVSREGAVACRRAGQELYGRICESNLAGCLRLTGGWEEAETLLLDILREGEEAGFAKHQLMALGELAPLRADQGRWSEAEALCDRLEPLARRREELQHLAPLELTRARVMEARGDRAGALERLGDLREHWRRHSDDPITIGPALALGCRLGADWAEELDGLRSISPETRALADEAHGRFVEAAGRWERLGRPLDCARALRLAGGVERLERAREIVAGLGAAYELALVDAELRQLGVRIARGPRGSTRDAPGGLTRRELEVARLVAEGMSNGELARALVISERTAAHHVSSVLGKLGLSSRAQIVRWVVELER